MEHIVRNATGRQYKGPIVVDPRVPVTVANTGENEASNARVAQGELTGSAFAANTNALRTSTPARSS